MGKAETASRNKNVSGAADSGESRRWEDLGQFLVLLAMFVLLTSGASGQTEEVAAKHNYRLHPGTQVLLNDQELTPGVVETTDLKKVCSYSNASDPRKVTQKMKLASDAEYGIDMKKPIEGTKVPKGFHRPSLYERDHLISRELGGADDIKNIWTQPYYLKPGAVEKDAVENWLHAQVCPPSPKCPHCVGTMDLKQAQHDIATDWYAVYLKMNELKPGKGGAN